MGRRKKSAEEISEINRRIAIQRHHPERSAETPSTAPAPGPNPLVALGDIDDYDKKIGQPRTWQDAKSRESVIGELIENEGRRDENAVRRGKLFTREQMEERERDYDELVFTHLARLTDFVSSLVDPAARDDARMKTKEFVTATRKAIADQIKARK